MEHSTACPGAGPPGAWLRSGVSAQVASRTSLQGRRAAQACAGGPSPTASPFLVEPSFMLDEHHTAKLRSWIAQRLGTDDLIVEAVQPLGGGSIQENWRVRCAMDHGQETREFVLRKDAPAPIASSRPRCEEFAILAAAYRAGVCVPEPVGFCGDP